MNKKLELAPVGFSDDGKFVQIKIRRQSHRRDAFGNNGKADFTWGNVVLLSMYHIEYLKYPGNSEIRFFVRGADLDKDSDFVSVPLETLPAILEAVVAYNKANSKTEAEVKKEALEKRAQELEQEAIELRKEIGKL